MSLIEKLVHLAMIKLGLKRKVRLEMKNGDVLEGYVSWAAARKMREEIAAREVGYAEDIGGIGR